MRATGRTSKPAASSSGIRPAWMSDVLPEPVGPWRTASEWAMTSDTRSRSSPARPKNCLRSLAVNGRGPGNGLAPSPSCSMVVSGSGLGLGRGGGRGCGGGRLDRRAALAERVQELLRGAPVDADLQLVEVLVEVLDDVLVVVAGGGDVHGDRAGLEVAEVRAAQAADEHAEVPVGERVADEQQGPAAQGPLDRRGDERRVAGRGDQEVEVVV